MSAVVAPSKTSTDAAALGREVAGTVASVLGSGIGSSAPIYTRRPPPSALASIANVNEGESEGEGEGEESGGPPPSSFESGRGPLFTSSASGVGWTRSAADASAAAKAREEYAAYLASLTRGPPSSSSASSVAVTTSLSGPPPSSTSSDGTTAGMGGTSGSSGRAPAGPDVGVPIDMEMFQGDILGRKYCVGRTAAGDYFFDYAKAPAECDLTKIKFFRVTGASMAEVEAELKKLLGKVPKLPPTAEDKSPPACPGRTTIPAALSSSTTPAATLGLTMASPPPGGWGTRSMTSSAGLGDGGSGSKASLFPISEFRSFTDTTPLLRAAAGLGPGAGSYVYDPETPALRSEVGLSMGKKAAEWGAAKKAAEAAVTSGDGAGEGGKTKEASLISGKPKLGGNGTRKHKKSRKHGSRRHSK